MKNKKNTKTKLTCSVFTVLSCFFFSALFLFAVKFLREVTPYFRKASIISEVGWELQRAFLCPLGPGSTSSPPAPRSPPRADTRYIPLQLTHLARNLKYQDPGEVCVLQNGRILISYFVLCHFTP